MANYFRSSRSKNAPLHNLDVRPDDTDARDYIFRPALALLPQEVDHRNVAPVRNQKTEGACVGFALATVINVSLGLRRKNDLGSTNNASIEYASPRMLYEMGRRYDEWQGEDYQGTSLRGAMKGWHKHGVTTEELWPYYVPRKKKKIPDQELTPERAKDALRRPIGAYYRIVDSDVSHVQAAVVEGDAVLASAWVHEGWQVENLEDRGPGKLKRILPTARAAALHAFAIVGYTQEGFIIQNSWGDRWGSDGYALLCYDDWFESRQDAWVARPAPTTLDSAGTAKIFIVEFSGGKDQTRAETAASGLDIDPRALPYFINTGDRGELSDGALLATKEEELADMAQRVLTASLLQDNCRHVVLYAHGGLNSESYAAQTANRLWSFCNDINLAAYFFVWESGITESIGGWFKSTDDASGPTQFSLEDVWENIKKGAGALTRKLHEQLGASLAPVARNVFWDEMKGRAEGASKSNGGAALFMKELFRVVSRTPNDNYKIHIVAHSAGSIYLGWLYQNVIRNLLSTASNVELASIQFMAPAITVKRAKEAFFANGAAAVTRDRFIVYMLKPGDEESDTIYIYPSSLLTYVADHLEDADKRVPIFGIRKDFVGQNIDFATPVSASESDRHGEFDDTNHEAETIFTDIASCKF